MIGGDLFHRIFLRFLVGMVIAFVLFLLLVHVFQVRVVYAEWRKDLHQEAHWLGLHLRSEDDVIRLASAWQLTHSTTRLTFFDAGKSVVADSHPDRPVPDLEAVIDGNHTIGYIAAAQRLGDDGWLVTSRPTIPAFPSSLQWELIGAAALIVLLISLFLFPFVRSMSIALKELTQIAGDVSSGQFGKSIKSRRRGELGKLVEAVNDMSAKLAQSEQLSTRLLHDVSHELRSPLGRIQVMTETISRRPEMADECLKGISQEVALLDRLVGDLVETARTESARDACRAQPFSLCDWANETIQRLEFKAGASGIGLTTDLPEEDRQVSGDPQRLSQAVGNLVDNAINCLDGRADGQIDVSLRVESDRWTLDVTDNGPGIPQEHRPHVFRRFYRVDEHRGRAQGGVGLGLSLVKSIAEAHAGDVAVASTSGQGTTVRLTIPFERS